MTRGVHLGLTILIILCVTNMWVCSFYYFFRIKLTRQYNSETKSQTNHVGVTSAKTAERPRLHRF